MSPTIDPVTAAPYDTSPAAVVSGFKDLPENARIGALTQSEISNYSRYIRSYLQEMSIIESGTSHSSTYTFGSDSTSYGGVLLINRDPAYVKSKIEHAVEELSRRISAGIRCDGVIFKHNQRSPEYISCYLKVNGSWREFRLYLLKKFTNMAVVYYGYGGYGNLFKWFCEGIGLDIDESGAVICNANLDGEPIGSFTVAEDIYSFEGLTGKNDYRRISYSTSSIESLVYSMCGSEMFNLSCAKLNGDLANTEPNPSPELIRVQELVRKYLQTGYGGLRQNSSEMTAAQRSSLIKRLQSSGAVVSMEASVTDRARDKIFKNRLEEAKAVLNVSEEIFNLKVDALSKSLGSTFKRTVMMCNPITLARKLDPSSSAAIG